MIADDTPLDDLLVHFSPDHSAWVSVGHRIGGSALATLLEELGGTNLHVPTLEHFRLALWRRLRDEDIRARFRGNNYHEISADYGLSPRQIRNIVHGPKK